MASGKGRGCHRTPTKDHLLAQLWMRSARAGQVGFLAALGHDDLDHALDRAALHYPRWSRLDVPAAQVLAHGRELLTPEWPPDLAAELAVVNDDLVDAVAGFTRRWYGDTTAEHRRVVSFALLDLPPAAIRRYLLAGRPPPTPLDGSVLAAVRAALSVRT